MHYRTFLLILSYRIVDLEKAIATITLLLGRPGKDTTLSAFVDIDDLYNKIWAILQHFLK